MFHIGGHHEMEFIPPNQVIGLTCMLGHLQGWMNRLGGRNSDAWSIIWNLGGPPKLCHSLWRSCIGALATKGRLYDRHIVEDGSCFHCKGAKVVDNPCYVWMLCCRSYLEIVSFSTTYLDYTSSSFVEIFIWMHPKLDRPDLLTFASLLWAAWSFQNSVVHGEPWNNSHVGAYGFLRLVNDYKACFLSIWWCFIRPFLGLLGFLPKSAMFEWISTLLLWMMQGWVWVVCFVMHKVWCVLWLCAKFALTRQHQWLQNLLFK